MIDDRDIINIIRKEMSKEKSLEAVTALKRVIDKIEVAKETELERMYRAYEQESKIQRAEAEKKLLDAFK